MTMEVSAEVQFAQTLASNDKKFRDRALKRLQKYISVRSLHGDGLSHDDFIKLWKGLHYCMWMQDKPLIQEELSQKMVSLLYAFPRLQDALSFVNVFFITEAREWTGIDRLRLDKFMLLIREILHETFELLSRNAWPELECQTFSQNLTASIMNEDTVKIPYGIKMHLADIYLAEMRKVSLEGMNGKKMTILMFPFIYFLLKTKRRELAQTVYNKTLKAALQGFGLWPWQDGKRENNGVSSFKEKARDGEGQDDSDVGGDYESEDNSEDEDESEDDRMETDEDDDSPKSKKFDLSSLLRLLHQLAKDPKVEIRNRRYVYGIVNNYITKDSTILMRTQNDSKVDGVIDVNISSVIQLTGGTEEEDSDNKKRRRRRKRRREEEGMEMDSQDAVNSVVRVDEKLQKTACANNLIDKMPNQGKENKKKSEKKQISEKKRVNNKDKHLDKTAKQIINIEEMEAKHRADVTSGKTKSNKRKRMSGDGDQENISDQVDLKKMKIDESVKSKNPLKTSSPANLSHCNKNDNYKSPICPRNNVKDSSVTTPTTLKTQRNKKGVEEENSDTNANARSPPLSPLGKKVISLSSPMECVVYKQKSPKVKPGSISKIAKSMTSQISVPATNKFIVSDSSPSRLSVKKDEPGKSVAVKAGSAFGNKIKSRSTSPVISNSRTKVRSDSPCVSAATTEDESPPQSKSPPPLLPLTSEADKSEVDGQDDSRILDGLYNVVSTPCKMIKQAVGLVAPATDPGVSREKVVTIPDQLTPGSQKKVVFDLRKNKANKFKDYLKTLANDRSPAFEPSKSPGQGILKSTSSENSLCSQYSSTCCSTPNTKKGKGGVSQRKSQSPAF